MIHDLRATPATCFWGFFDAALPPVLRVRSGDLVRIETLTHQAGDAPDLMMDAGVRAVCDAIPMADARSRRARHDRARSTWRAPPPATRWRFGSLDGAAAGLRHQHAPREWGHALRRVRQGAHHHLPDATPHRVWPAPRSRSTTQTTPRYERPASSCRPTPAPASPRWPTSCVPLRPHFGVCGVAPREPGRINSIPPGAFGGNVDNWRFGPGAAMHYPVFHPGALCYLGDPHMAEGDGELSRHRHRGLGQRGGAAHRAQGSASDGSDAGDADPLDRARVRRGSRSGDGMRRRGRC